MSIVMDEKACPPAGGHCTANDQNPDCGCAASARPTLRPACADDLSRIKSLLSSCQLPTDDLTPAGLSRFLVATAGDGIGGVCGIEAFGADGVIRSLAVDPALRGQGVGARLVAENERKAREAGVEKLYLLTTTARDYLLRQGYALIEREMAPEAVRSHPQFRGLCPASAQCLFKTLG